MSSEQVCYFFADAYSSLSESLQLQHRLQSCDTEFHLVVRESLLADAAGDLQGTHPRCQLHAVPTGCTNLLSQLLYLQDNLDSRRTVLMCGARVFKRPQDLQAFLMATSSHQAVVLATTEACHSSHGIRCGALGVIEELTDGSEPEFYLTDGMLLLSDGRLALAPAMQSLRRGRAAVAGGELMSLVNDAVLLGIDVRACDRLGRLIPARSATIPFKPDRVQVCKTG